MTTTAIQICAKNDNKQPVVQKTINTEMVDHKNPSDEELFPSLDKTDFLQLVNRLPRSKRLPPYLISEIIKRVKDNVTTIKKCQNTTRSYVYFGTIWYCTPDGEPLDLTWDEVTKILSCLRQDDNTRACPRRASLYTSHKYLAAPKRCTRPPLPPEGEVMLLYGYKILSTVPTKDELPRILGVIYRIVTKSKVFNYIAHVDAKGVLKIPIEISRLEANPDKLLPSATVDDAQVALSPHYHADFMARAGYPPSKEYFVAKKLTQYYWAIL